MRQIIFRGQRADNDERVYGFLTKMWGAKPPYVSQGWKDEVALFTKNGGAVIDERNIIHFIEKEEWFVVK